MILTDASTLQIKYRIYKYRPAQLVCPLRRVAVKRSLISKHHITRLEFNPRNPPILCNITENSH